MVERPPWWDFIAHIAHRFIHALLYSYMNTVFTVKGVLYGVGCFILTFTALILHIWYGFYALYMCISNKLLKDTLILSIIHSIFNDNSIRDHQV